MTVVLLNPNTIEKFCNSLIYTNKSNAYNKTYFRDWRFNFNLRLKREVGEAVVSVYNVCMSVCLWPRSSGTGALIREHDCLID